MNILGAIITIFMVLAFAAALLTWGIMRGNENDKVQKERGDTPST